MHFQNSLSAAKISFFNPRWRTTAILKIVGYWSYTTTFINPLFNLYTFPGYPGVEGPAGATGATGATGPAAGTKRRRRKRQAAGCPGKP